MQFIRRSTTISIHTWILADLSVLIGSFREDKSGFSSLDD